MHAREEGLQVYYALAGDDVVALYTALHHVAENRVAEVEKLVRTWLRHKDEMEPVPRRSSWTGSPRAWSS